MDFKIFKGMHEVKKNVNQDPLVSICCQTYNHVNYIKEALEGFLVQVVDFNYEILLRDDASTD
jgi:glycosyltransferase involved in cell wall biosynthesis